MLTLDSGQCFMIGGSLLPRYHHTILETRIKFLSFLGGRGLHWVFIATCRLSLVASRATLHWSTRASHCGGFSHCRARALECRLRSCDA